MVQAGLSQGQGFLIQAGNIPFTVTGLSPATDYCFYIRDSCGPGSVSEWINTCETTECTAFTLPWSEDFDGPDWQAGTGATNVGNQISPCWSRPSDQNPNFGTWSGPTASANTGPTGAPSGTGNYIYTEASGAAGTGEITTPSLIVPVTFTAPRLKFLYHMYGAAIDSLVVEVSNGGAYSSVFSQVGPLQSADTDMWQKASLDFSAYIGDTIQIRFKGTSNNFPGDIAIDDVAVEEITCPAPDSLQFVSSTPTSIDVSWKSGGASQWQIHYRVAGSGTAFNYLSALSNPTTIAGLNPGTSYEIKVRDSCATGDVSEWEGPILANTTCSAIGAPWSENFDSGAWIRARDLPILRM
ncbi:MAG: fibronectin type III domain-containing protein [Owenweeksia sp.]|nr:fibronectin type III domain-containing protein [Owenweeksia sp.]